MPNIEVLLRKTVEEAKSKAVFMDWQNIEAELMKQASAMNLSIQRISELIGAMETHFEKRAYIMIPTNHVEVLFSNKIDELRTRRGALQSVLDKELGSKFDQLLNSLAHKLSEILFMNALPGIYDSQVYKALVELTVVMSSELRMKKEQELRSEILKRKSELETQENVQKLRKEKEQSTYRISIREKMRTLSENIPTQTTMESLEKMRDTGNLAVEIRSILTKLTNRPEAEEIKSDLFNMFEVAISQLRIKKKNNGYIELSHEVKLKVFIPEESKQLHWSVKYKLVDGMVNIYFEDSIMGKRINPHGGIDNHQVTRQVYDPRYSLRVSEADFREMMKYVRK